MVRHLENLLLRHSALTCCANQIEQTAQLLTRCFESDNKLLICGNGGSAADAEHFAAELLKRFERDRPMPADLHDALDPELREHLETPLPAIPLTGFTAFHTAFSNDRNAEYAFAQLTLALGRPGDALLCISTSGESKNLLHACRVARACQMHTLALTGETGGALRQLVDVCICMPEREVAAVQELHLPVYHTLCRMLEQHFWGG